MKLKHTLLLAVLLFISGSVYVHAQDSSTATSTTSTTTEVTPEEPTRPDYMKIYGWAGGILITIVAIGVIGVEIKNMNKADEEEAEKAAEEERNEQ